MKFVEHVKRRRRFYGTVGSLNLGALCMGLAMSWPGPTFNYLYDNHYQQQQQQHQQQLPDKQYDSTIVAVSSLTSRINQTWIESTINAGASFGSLVSILISELWGRRASFYLSAGIVFVFWILLATSGVDRIMIVSSAAVAGLGIGVYFATAVLYVPEISSAENRGLVGASVFLFCYLGAFGLNLASQLFDVAVILGAQIVVPIAFLAAVRYFMIESPMYLFKRGMVLKAKISLRDLRDRSTVLDIDDEYRAMESFFNTNVIKQPSQLLQESLCPKNLRTLTLVTLPLLCLGQMISSYAINDHTEKIFESLYPRTGKLVTSFVNVVSVICCLLVIERCGRKPLLVFASVASGICCLMLASYSLIDNKGCGAGVLESKHRIYPIVVLCVYYAIYALGLIPVLPIVTGEIFPCQTKTTTIAVCTSLIYLVAFFMERFYESLDDYVSACEAFALFTMFGSIGLPFAVVLLPETRGKSLLQIQNDLFSFATV